MRARAHELAALLVDAVEGGASLGFLPPLGLREAAAWWDALAPAVEDGGLIVWAAAGPHGLTGTISLLPCDKANSRHRAEVLKLMVHREARGRGLGRELLAAAEQGAARAGCTLLLLDTETGSGAEFLYRAAGWTRFGVVPGYAVSAATGTPRDCSFFYKDISAAS